MGNTSPFSNSLHAAARLAHTVLNNSTQSILLIGQDLFDLKNDFKLYKKAEIILMSNADDEAWWDEDHYSLTVLCLNDVSLKAARHIHNHTRRCITIAYGQVLDNKSVFTLARDLKFDLKFDWKVAAVENGKEYAVLLLESV